MTKLCFLIVFGVLCGSYCMQLCVRHAMDFVDHAMLRAADVVLREPLPALTYPPFLELKSSSKLKHNAYRDAIRNGYEMHN